MTRSLKTSLAILIYLVCSASRVFCASKSEVRDTTPPTIEYITASSTILYSRTSQIVELKIHSEVSDDDSKTASWKILEVTPTGPSCAGKLDDACPDQMTTTNHLVVLKYAANKPIAARTYNIKILAQDVNGNSMEGEINVRVPANTDRPTVISRR